MPSEHDNCKSISLVYLGPMFLLVTRVIYLHVYTTIASTD